MEVKSIKEYAEKYLGMTEEEYYRDYLGCSGD